MLAIILNEEIYGTFRAHRAPFAGIHYHDVCCSQGSFCGTSCFCVYAPQRKFSCSRGSAVCDDILYMIIFLSSRAPQKASGWGVQNQHVCVFFFFKQSNTGHQRRQHQLNASTLASTDAKECFRFRGGGYWIAMYARGVVGKRATAARTQSAVLPRGLV